MTFKNTSSGDEQTEHNIPCFFKNKGKNLAELRHPLVNVLFLVLLEVEQLKPFVSDIHANAEPVLEIYGKDGASSLLGL